MILCSQVVITRVLVVRLGAIQGAIDGEFIVLGMAQT
jgi:hypothetical protein